MNPRDELEAERYQKALLLLDMVARGEGTVSVAEALAKWLGIDYSPIRRRPITLEGTCNDF